MAIAALVALSLVALACGAFALHRYFAARSPDASLLDRPADDTTAAEDAAAAQATTAAQTSASEVIRASNPVLAARVAELRARGRAGK